MQPLGAAESVNQEQCSGGDACVQQPRALRSGVTAIADIQGAGHRSPWEGMLVSDVQGVVTHVVANGFTFQDPQEDLDERTSEALFVLTSEGGALNIGDRVSVSGRVVEYRPSCATCVAQDRDSAHLSVTQLEQVQRLEVLATGLALPPARVLGAQGLALPTATEHVGDVEQLAAPFAPAEDALDFYESLEHVRVELTAPVVVGATRGAQFMVTSCDSSELEHSCGHGASPTRLDRVAVFTAGATAFDVADRFEESLSGILDTRTGEVRLLADVLPALSRGAAGDFTPERVWASSVADTRSAARGSDPLKTKHLNVATLNAHNLSLQDSDEKFESLAQLIVGTLGAPDVLALQEVQDDSGARDDGVTTAEATLQRLTEAIVARSGPQYRALQVDPLDNQDGGEPGGNIRQVLLYHAERGLQAVHTGALGTALTTHNPGRLEPGNAAFRNSRKPLAAQFSFEGQRVFVIALHLVSKLGDQPLLGRYQPATQHSLPQRLQQVAVVADAIADLQRAEPAALALVLGDLNDAPGSAPLALLRESGLVSACEFFSRAACYTYVFRGQAAALDHILISEAWAPRVVEAAIAHVHADYCAALSDHDPVLMQIQMGSASAP